MPFARASGDVERAAIRYEIERTVEAHHAELVVLVPIEMLEQEEARVGSANAVEEDVANGRFAAGDALAGDQVAAVATHRFGTLAVSQSHEFSGMPCRG